MSDLHARLRALGLITASGMLDDLVALATKRRWGPMEILEHVADAEEKDRARSPTTLLFKDWMTRH